jgi:hypothetical protein
VTRATNLGALIGLLALGIGLAGWSLPAVALPLLRQEAAATLTEVGSGPVGDRGFSATGRAVYQPDGISFFGYLTQVNVLDPTLLANGSPITEQNAVFTYSGEIADPTVQNRGDVTMFSGDGVFRVYVQPQSALSWSDPASFAAGQAVAEFSIGLHDTLQRQAPDVGILVGDDALTQTVAGEFTLAGQRYRFGQKGIGERLRTVGALAGAERQPGTVALTGSASVTAREAIVVRLGGTPAAVASPQAVSCPALEPWLSRSLAGLSQVQSLGTAFASGDVTTLNADVVSQAAADVDTLITTLQSGEVPVPATDANQLVIAALQAYASALQDIASAVANGDADLLAQGQSTLTYGDNQIADARDAVNALGSSCPSA